MSVVENARENLLSKGSWPIDSAHSTIEFRVRHMVVETVAGRFRDFDGAINSGAEPTISGSSRVVSRDTFHAERDAHLRSSDFFDAERVELLLHVAAVRVD